MLKNENQPLDCYSQSLFEKLAVGEGFLHEDGTVIGQKEGPPPGKAVKQTGVGENKRTKSAELEEEIVVILIEEKAAEYAPYLKK